MKNLKFLELENFGIHESLKLKFEKGFTIISGKTGVGKSWVVRALDFVFYNNWDNSYYRNNSKKAVIQIGIDDIIGIRQKTKSMNYFKIGNQEFNSLGTGELPEIIQKFLGVKPIRYDEGSQLELNIHRQDDLPFLLFDSGPSKSKLFGRLTKLHIFDIALNNLNNKKNILLAKQKDVNSQIENYENELSQFDKVEEQLKVAMNLQDMYNNVEKVKERKLKLENYRIRLDVVKNSQNKMIDNMRSIENKKFQYSKIINIYINKLVLLKEDLIQLVEKRNKLRNLYGYVAKITNNNKNNTRILLLKDKIENKLILLSNLLQLKKNYKIQLSMYNNITESLAFNKKRQAELKSGKCPTCGNTFILSLEGEGDEYDNNQSGN
jgi:hypothetical protein